MGEVTRLQSCVVGFASAGSVQSGIACGSAVCLPERTLKQGTNALNEPD